MSGKENAATWQNINLNAIRHTPGENVAMYRFRLNVARNYPAGDEFASPSPVYLDPSDEGVVV